MNLDRGTLLYAAVGIFVGLITSVVVIAILSSFELTGSRASCESRGGVLFVTGNNRICLRKDAVINTE